MPYTPSVTYSTNDQVRQEAGFTSNANILDIDIDSYRVQAFGQIKGFIGQTYDLVALATNFTGSAAAGTLARIEILFATGWLLIRDYGSGAEGTDKNGYPRVQLAQTMLNSIMANKLKLFDTNNQEFLLSSIPVGAKFDSFPASSHDLNQDGETCDRAFKVSDIW